MMRVIAPLLVALCLALPANSASLSGYSLPDAYPAGGQTLLLNGMGIRTLTIFNVRVYVAGLYLAQKSRDARAILASPGTKVLMMQFLHKASKSDVEKQYREGEERNCGHLRLHAEGDAGAVQRHSGRRVREPGPGAPCAGRLHRRQAAVRGPEEASFGRGDAVAAPRCRSA